MFTMKITAKIAKANEEDRCFWSFEYFPPKTEAGVINLYDRMERMYTLGPEFIDVTWNAGGSSSDVTMQVCTTAQSVYGLETCMHLTCTNMPREKIDIALKDAKAAGIQNILALRGDPPRGELNWTKCETGFSYAGDLVKYIRQEYGDYFCIGVAGYPEGHTENPDNDEDMKHLKAKCDAGADYIVTQLFYDVDIFLKWYAECRDVGITVPILPGLMPIQNFGGFKRMTSLCKTYVPQEIYNALEPIKEDDKAVKDYGVQLAVNMCNKMKENGIRGFHFYTLNLERSTRLILEGLKFIAPIEQVRPLPWNPFKLQHLQSLANGREKENVRPIFWKNRTRSYILRTEAWDDFPNGRWGDARSPAFGEIDGYGFNLKYPVEECLTLWGHPKSAADVFALFEKYCKGDLTVLPWSDAPLFPESDVIRSNLANINAKGFLTINSQPAVDGAPSSHPIHGWGPKNGFVYQKAYLEFFVSPTMLDQLVKRIASYPYITYYAVNKQGDLSTNTQGDSPNAVTWGVFPSQEILQPTIVDAASFMAWKDEAFELWNKWAKLYDDAHADSGVVVKEMCDTYFLVNVVNNNYKEGNIFEIFDEVPVDGATRTTLIFIISGVSATVTPLLNQLQQPVVGVPSIQNVDFPLLRQPYADLMGIPNQAKFLDPAVMGICRLAGFNPAYEPLMDPTTHLNPNLALISILDAYVAGCPRYTYLGYANGWYQECPAGTDVASMLKQPGPVPCSTAATRPTLALWIQLGPLDNWCCKDVFYAMPTPLNGYLPEEQQSLVSQTGILADDAVVWFGYYNVSYIQVTAEGAGEKYTAVMRSKGFDFYLISRQIISLGYLILQVGVMVITVRQEGFHMNLKWGVLSGIFVMTLMTACLHALFLAFRHQSYQLSTHATPAQIALMCYGFAFGYESLSLMLLKWLTISTGGSKKPSKRAMLGLNVYKRAPFFIYLTMVWFPVISTTCVVTVIREAALNSLDVLDLFYKLWNTLCGSLSISLFLHASGFLFAGYRLTSTLNRGKQMQGATSAGAKSYVSTVARESAFAQQGPKPKRSGLTVTIRNLMVAVVIGWTLFAVQLLLNWVLGLSSRYGFFAMFCYFDGCMAVIAAASYFAMSAGMMEAAIDTLGSSKGKSSATGKESGVRRGGGNDARATKPLQDDLDFDADGGV
ncbi:hypothetical protein HDU87_006489 [Geranomyces variabilis]|uniref:methylenetetrahydrofolate reductase (NADH) n=1 Tax=Geranomyces variabilis TaxID=109894 RepID=A0AAD5TFZ9_9FUNG|nr:hypothetical protein HDU87_006489 [Geranomyces variabilis]